MLLVFGAIFLSSFPNPKGWKSNENTAEATLLKLD
jgi:hypothetical protein